MQVHYTGTLDDGAEFDSSRQRDPLEFVIGAKSVISGFDNAVKGLKIGESKKQDVPPQDGYGALPLSKFAIHCDNHDHR